MLYGVQGTINNSTGGFVFTGIAQNNGSAVYNLEIDANVTINGNLIVNGTVNTAQITSGAVSQVVFASGTGNVSISINLTAGDSVLTFFGYQGGDAQYGLLYGYVTDPTGATNELAFSTSSAPQTQVMMINNIYVAPYTGTYAFLSDSLNEYYVESGRPVTVTALRLSR